MFYHNISPVLLNLGPFEIRYYGVIFVLSVIISYFLLKLLAKERRLKLSEEDIVDLLLYIVIGTVLGARIFYVLIYNLNFYLANPTEIIAIWHGGLSFHGGLIGAIISGLIFCKKNKISFYELADICVIPLAFGLFLGRIGNFINGELYGRITNFPWAFKFKDAEGFRHPSQLYESFKNLIIFFILFNIRNKKLPKGFLFWSFITLYGLFRFFIEFFREPDQQIGFILGLTMGQILTIIMFVLGIYMLYYLKKNKKI